MELELYKEKIEGMNLVYEAQVIQEEACETIIPDSQPDILKVMETSVNVLLKSKEAEQGRVIIKGILQTTVVYAAEDDNFYKVEVPVPYTVIANCHDITDKSAIMIMTDICSSDAVISNSRKIVVKVNYSTNICVYGKCTVEFCCKAENDDIHQLIDDMQLVYMSEYSEKTFVISDDIAFDNTEGGSFDILSAEYSIINVDYGISGRRVIIRGAAETNLTVLMSDSVVPVKIKKKSDFSQILDTDVSELDNIMISVMLTGCYCDSAIFSGESGTQVELHAVAQCEIYKKMETTVMRDLYCVYGDIICDTEDVAVYAGNNIKAEVLSLREKFENLSVLKEIISAKVQFGEVRIESETVKINGVFYAYGLNSDEIPTVFKHSFSVSQKTDIVHKSKIKILSINAELIAGEISFDCEIELVSKERAVMQFNTVKSGEIQANNIWDNAPSAVLCRLKEGETLWSLAKTNLSTVDIIKKINNVENEFNIEEGTILLVPKV